MLNIHAVSKDCAIDGCGIGDTLLVCTLAESLRISNPGTEIRLCIFLRNQAWARLFWQGTLGIEEDLLRQNPVAGTHLFPFDDRLSAMDQFASSRGITRHQYCTENVGAGTPQPLAVTIDDADRSWARQVLSHHRNQGKQFIGIAPMSKSIQRQWPLPY